MLEPTRILSKEPADFHGNISDMYRDLANAINGNYGEWTPTVSGGTDAGVGTYTAATTYGLWYRQGLLTDVWFMVTWTAHTGAGNMLVNLPFKVMFCTDNIFVSTLEITGVTLGVGYSYAALQCNSNLSSASVIQCGSGNTLANIAIINGAVQLRGHARYIGQENE